MIAVFPILYVFWKYFKKTEFRKPEHVDLFQDLEEIEEYHRNFVEAPPKYVTFFFFFSILSALTRMRTDCAD